MLYIYTITESVQMFKLSSIIMVTM